MRSKRSATIASTLAAALAAVTSAACGGGAIPDAPRIAVERAEDGPTCTDARALATYGTGDGFTFSHGLAVCADGRVELHYSTRAVVGPLEAASLGYEIDPSDVRRIEDALRAADFASLDRSYVSQAADIAAYSVTYGGKTVSADDFAIRDGDVPERLLGLIGLFESILAPAVADAESWVREDPALLLRHKAEQTRRSLEACRSSARLDANARRRVERLRELLEGGLTVAEGREVDGLIRVVALC